ncbi:MAG: serine hydrolase domain-containing protein [Anaerovorax sp.]|nr:serine hydrolase domain-containing protein [Anaerovorax sp.]
MKRIFSIILVVAMVAVFVAGCAGGPSDELAVSRGQVSLEGLKEEADKMASAMISDYGVTSIQYAIIDNGKITFSGNNGVYAKDNNTPITNETMYGIASLSKIYVSAATMMLVDWGKVDLDKPLAEYIPEFKMSDERYKEITPRMLLNHSSGLYGSHYHNASLFNDNDTSVQDNLLQNLQNEKLHSNPGEFSVYCNNGFQLLEILVERVSQMSYTEFLEKYISQPLNLENTKTPLDDFDREKLAKLYEPMFEKELPTLNTNLLGTGGLYSTAEEICRFSEVLMGKNESILSTESAEKMQNEEYKRGIWVSDEQNMTGYGLGWDSTNLWPFSDYNIKAVAKGGDGSYHSSLVALPEHNIAMAVVSSGGSSLYNQIFASNILLKVLKDKGVIEEIKPNQTFTTPVSAEVPKELLKYSGVYGEGTVFGRTYGIEFEKDSFTIPEGLDGMIPAEKFIYIGNMEFKNESGTATATFKETKNNKTYLQVKKYMDFPGLGQVISTDFQSMKLPHNTREQDVLKTWEKRDGKKYFALLEKPNSDMYLTSMLMINKIDLDAKNGYAQGCKIVDKNNAISTIEIPVMNGRDLTDLCFYQENGVEYLKTIDMTFIKEDFVKPLDDTKSHTITIGANGHSRWFKIDGKTENKNIEVTCTKGATFAIYNENAECVNLTTISGANAWQLPENGMIVFSGKPNDIFNITLK